MAWTDLDQFVIDDILGFQTMNKIVDNFDFLKAAGVGTAYITNAAVIAAKLGASAVETAKINNLAVTEGKLAASAVAQGKLKTSTGSVTGSLAQGAYFEVSMQDYTFSPNIYGASYRVFEVMNQLTTGSGTVGRFTIYNRGAVGAVTYGIYYRYVTATDEPFLYAIQDKATGKIEHLWMCEDPPPGYWGVDEKPDDFVPPIVVSDSDGKPKSMTAKEEIIIFKHKKAEFFDILDRAKADKKTECEVLNDTFEYDKDKKLFKTKNLSEV